MPFLLRVELPDVPGSLGRVATTIGEAGGDIEAIEIVEHRDDGTAVDDVLLETAPGVMPDSIVSACNQLDGVLVVWISRYAAGGQLFLDLEAVEQLTESPTTAFDELVDLLPITFKADWSMRVRELADGTAEVLHRTTAAPESVGPAGEWFPCAQARRLPLPAGWSHLDSTLVAGAPLTDDRGGPTELVVLARRGGPEFIDSELARLHHLAALAVTIRKAG